MTCARPDAWSAGRPRAGRRGTPRAAVGVQPAPSTRPRGTEGVVESEKAATWRRTQTHGLKAAPKASSEVVDAGRAPRADVDEPRPLVPDAAGLVHDRRLAVGGAGPERATRVTRSFPPEGRQPPRSPSPVPPPPYPRSPSSTSRSTPCSTSATPPSPVSRRRSSPTDSSPCARWPAPCRRPGTGRAGTHVARAGHHPRPRRPRTTVPVRGWPRGHVAGRRRPPTARPAWRRTGPSMGSPSRATPPTCCSTSTAARSSAASARRRRCRSSSAVLARRSPSKGIAVVTHAPQLLDKNRCFMLSGSRRGDRRVPACGSRRGRRSSAGAGTATRTTGSGWRRPAVASPETT